MAKSKKTVCGILCTLICYGLIVGTGIAFLVESFGYVDEPSHLWYWVIISVGVFTFHAIYFVVRLMEITEIKFVHEDGGDRVKVIKKFISHSKPLDYILVIIDIALTIWGCIIYNQTKVTVPYPEHIWKWFMVIFMTSLVVWSCFGCALCCACCAICTGQKVIEERREGV